MELPDHRLTLEEYLKLEAISTEPLEYIDGYALIRNRPSKGHEKIAGNLIMTTVSIPPTSNTLLQKRKRNAMP